MESEEIFPLTEEQMDALGIKDFDPAECLTSIDVMKGFIELSLGSNVPELTIKTLGIISRSKGIDELAEKVGIPKAEIQSALANVANSDFATVIRIFVELNLHLKPHISDCDVSSE